MTKTVQGFSLFRLAILLFIANQAVAQAGHLDASFAKGGIFATTDNRTSAAALAIQSDGKIVVAGTGTGNNGLTDVLFRLKTDGKLDASFGSGGVVNFQPTTLVFGFFALALQPDGKIVAAGSGARDGRQPVIQVARIKTDGSLDKSFGNGGFTDPIVFPIEAGNLALQPDGKIVVAAGVNNPNGVPSQMARFNANGELDTRFGSSGTINLAYPGPTQLAAQADGKILVASGAPSRLVFQAQPVAQPGAITRYNSNGKIDKTFGSAGTTSSVASASALLLQSDGKIVVAGSLTSKLNSPSFANNIGFGVVRYAADGVVDTSFGSGGVAVLDFGSNAPVSGAFSVAIQSNGDLVAAGAAGGTLFQNKVVSAFGLTRFTGDGKPDTSFGSKGRVITTVGIGLYAWVPSVAIQSDGRIVAAGTAEFNGNNNAYVARYLAQ